TPTASRTQTPPASTATSTVTAAVEARPSPTPSPSPSATPTATATPSPTPSPTPTPTSTPLPTPNATDRLVRVPILMYHYLSSPPADADIYRLDLSVTPENFEQQLVYLKEAGYQSITLEALLRHLALGEPLPAKPVILTFDDGYRDNYENAFPLLQKYGFTGSFFLVTRPIDDGDPNYLTWDMVVEMSRAGMEFGAHTYRHADLTNDDIDYLLYEIVGSKVAIEERVGPIYFIAYPSGQYNQLTIDVVASAHFWGALTIHQGITQSYRKRFEMERIRVRGSDTLEEFIAKMEYDWP
ncbi:MAG: polysaccharide deacetylase family protein, partial [Anaerolineae bacterium]